MFKKVLYPTDFSDVSKKALAYIKQLKEAGTKEVVVLHVIDERDIEQISHLPEISLDSKKIEKERKEYAQKEIEEIEAELKESVFEIRSRIEKGIPFRDILRVEKEEDISLIVIGSHGKSCINEMLLGSVSEKVIRKSNKPVLVVRR